MSRLSLAAATLILTLPACTNDDITSSGERTCNVGADCASGTCLPNGTCVPVADASTLADGEDASGSDPGGAGPDGAEPATDGGTTGAGDAAPATDPGPAKPPDGGVLPTMPCQPNYDGVITKDELPFGPGFEAVFRVTQDVDPFSSEPACKADGSDCAWDLVDLDGETEEVTVKTWPIEDQWFAEEEAFEGATYVSKVGEIKLSLGFVELCNQTQLGVFKVTTYALELLGLVSEEEDDRTLLVFDPPVEMVRFPLEVGAAWKIETEAKGPLCNSMMDYTIPQTYEFVVDKAGSMKVPYGDFEHVLRVNTRIRRHMAVGVTPSRIRTHTFFSECFTAVAVSSSEEGDDLEEFEKASEVRRLSTFEDEE